MTSLPVCCLTRDRTIFSENCEGCERWQLNRVKVRKSRWRASALQYKCLRGPHSEAFYKTISVSSPMEHVLETDSTDDDVSIAEFGQKRAAEAELPNSPKRKAVEYIEINSDEFKVTGNLYAVGHYETLMEAENLQLEKPGGTGRGRGRPPKIRNQQADARIERRCAELKEALANAAVERQNLIHHERGKQFALQHELYQQQIRASVLQHKNEASAALLLAAQQDVAMANAAADEARQLLANEIVTSAAQDDSPAKDEAIGRAKVVDYLPDALFKHLNAFIHGRGKWVKHAKDLLNFGALRWLLITLVMCILRETVFTKKKWAHAVDMNHGLNLGGIEVVRDMEGLDKNGQGLIWSSGSIKEVHRAVERHMKTKISFRVIGERHDDIWIDGVELDAKQLLIYLIQNYGLEEKARAGGCEIAITVDGAKLDDYCIHITCGFKITDKDARDPLLVDERDPQRRGELLFSTMQSEKNSIPAISLIGKDNKSTYNKFFRSFFEFAQQLRDVGVPELGYKPFKVAEPQDMKSSQICMGRGGAAKQIPHFCHLCQKHSDDIARPNQMACGPCLRVPGKLCYCYPVMDGSVCAKLAVKKVLLDETAEAERLTFVCESVYDGDWHKYYMACDLQLVAFGAKPTVFEIPAKTSTRKYQAYLDNMVNTLSVLGVTCEPGTSLKSKQKSVIKALRIICKYAHYDDAANFSASVLTSMSRVRNQVPCVLHLHKRIVEKVISLLFTRSLDEINSEEKTKRVKHIEFLQSLVNTLALGKPNKPGHWKCPIKNGEEVGDCSFTDVQAKKVEDELPAIIAAALTLEESRKSDWVDCATQMTWILTTLRQRDDFTNTEIKTIGERIDSWTALWIQLVGKEGMTNYTHCMSSGHVVYFLKYWRNFYRYSNQGWENFNSQYRYVYCHRTQKGGSAGTSGEACSKMKPIGLWFLRRLYWMTKGHKELLTGVDK